ncbi:MAG: hypothetical protein SFX73_30070 [Kofleriaceae bacterium]|nr:hypothetical protein [Kofleriaceae bacterium]
MAPRRPRRAESLASKQVTAPPKKPMAMARRVSLFEREVTVRLAPIAVELLHGVARKLTEGELSGDAYAGSTMMTVDLARAKDVVSDAPDATTAQRVALLYAADERCRAHARRIAIADARRIAGCELEAPTVDVESRAKGPEVHLSLNVEATRRNA